MHSGVTQAFPPPTPPLTPIYVERKIPMESIERILFEADGTVKKGAKMVVIIGLGGCGKTQLIRKLVERHGNRFNSVHFVDGSSRESIQYDLVKHVRAVGPAHSQDSLEEAIGFLSQPAPDGERFLVIDNVDDPSLDLSRFLPRWVNGVVAITSRNHSRGQSNPVFHLKLDVMSSEESVELLARGLGKTTPTSEFEKASSMAVAEELGFLPIALVQAISYMFNTGCTEEMYIARLRNNKARVLGNPATSQLDMRYKTAFAAFDASYNLLSSRAQRFLHLLSFFHRQRFPLELIITAANDRFSSESRHYLDREDEFKRGINCLLETFFSSGEWDPVELDLIIASLRDHNLVNIVFDKGTKLLYTHPLIQEWGRLLRPKEDIQQFQDAAIRLLCCGANRENYFIIQYLPAHLEKLSSLWGTLHANDSACFGFILHEAGLYLDAAKLKTQVYDMVFANLEANHPSIIQASADLASTYGALGRYSDAEWLESEVLKQRTKLLGADHLDTMRASAHLAATYHRLGRYSEAERLQSGVLKQRIRLLGVEHPDTIDISANLAVTYGELGRYSDAEFLESDVMKQRTKALGAGHPDTMRSSTNLAVTCRRLGRYSEAEQLQSEVIQQRTKLLGVDHPDTMHAHSNLAVTYRQLGRYYEAEQIELEVTKQSTRILGVSHPDTVRASANLAVTYSRLGRYSEAERLHLEAVKQSTGLLGVDHPDTLRASANLVVTYHQSGRYFDAEELESEVLKQRTKLLGINHPETIDALANLAATYGALGQYLEAERLESEVLERRTKILGVSHPDTIRAYSNIAVTYRRLGRHSEAERLQSLVLEQNEKLLGVGHPNTMRAYANLAVTCHQLGHYPKAERLESEALKQRTKLLGVDHPDTIRASANLAVTYRRLKRYSDAEQLESTVLKRRLELLGANHPDTIHASANLAVTYR